MQKESADISSPDIPIPSDERKAVASPSVDLDPRPADRQPPELLARLRRGIAVDAPKDIQAAAQLALERLLAEAKTLTREERLALVALGPRYLARSRLPQEILRGHFTALDCAAESGLSAAEQLVFYLRAADSLGQCGYWLDLNPRATAYHGQDVAYFLTRALQRSTAWREQKEIPADHPAWRQLQDAVDHLQARAIQQSQACLWPLEKERLASRCRTVISDAKVSLADKIQFADALDAALQRFTGIEPAERAALWAEWASSWHALEDQVAERKVHRGDHLHESFGDEILYCLRAAEGRTLASFQRSCEGLHRLIEAMWRYGYPPSARWQLHRYLLTLVELQEQLSEGKGIYARTLAVPAECEHWLSVCRQAKIAGESLDQRFETSQPLPTAFPTQPPASRIASWRIRRAAWLSFYQTTAATEITEQNISAWLKTNTDQAKAFWYAVLAESAEILGPPPCALAWIPVGSVSREEMLPDSDWDGFFLLEQAEHRAHPYFERLFSWLWFQQRLLPSGILPLERRDFGFLLGENPDFFNTPEAMADQFGPVPVETAILEAMAFSVRWPAALQNDPSAPADTKRLLARYQERLSAHQGGEYSQRLVRWMLQQCWIGDQPDVRIATRLREAKPGTLIDLKNRLLRPLTIWCLAMKIAYQLPSSDQSSQAILKRLAEKRCFPAEWLSAIAQCEARWHQARWQRHRAQAQAPAMLSGEDAQDAVFLYPPDQKEPIPSGCQWNVAQRKYLEEVSQTVYRVLATSIPLWLAAEEKQRAFFNPVRQVFQQALSELPKRDDKEKKEKEEKDDKSEQKSAETLRWLALLATTYPTCFARKNQVDAPGAVPKQIAGHGRAYNQIPPPWRVHYHRALSDILQQYRSSPEQRKQILQFVEAIPDASGERLARRVAEECWQTVMLLGLTDAYLESDVAAVRIEWFDPLTGQRRPRAMRTADAQKLFDEAGRLRLSAQATAAGKRLVIPLYAEEKSQDKSKPSKVLAYLKVYPEMPGVQAVVDSLSWHISGYGALTTLCRVTHPKQKQAYPVLISQDAGNNLASVARQPDEDEKAIWKNLDGYAFTLKIIECLLINPEDYKFDNWAFFLWRLANGEARYRLTAFDNDHAFVEPLLSSALGSVKVNVKNALYCLSAMNQPLDKNAVTDFLVLDPLCCLEAWLSMLTRISQQSLFSPAEIQHFLDKHNCFIPVAFTPGTVAQIYEKLLRIRAALQDEEAPVNTPMDLLERLEPLLAQHYRQTFVPERQNPEARFASLKTNYEETQDPVSKQICRQSVFQARVSAPKSIAVIRESKAVDLRKAIQKDLLCTPQYMKERELPPIKNYYQKLGLLRTELQQGQLSYWLRLALSPYEREEALRRLDFKAIPPEKQKPLLQSLSRFTGYQALSLAHATALTDDLLTQIVKRLPELQALDISYCVEITPAAIYEILYRCRNLQVLRLAGLPKLMRLDPALFKYSSRFFAAELLGTHLQLLDVRGCLCLQEISGLYLPHLQTLITEECSELKKINIQAWWLKNFRNKNCIALKDCQTDGILPGEDKEAIQWLEQSAKNGDEGAIFSLSKNPHAFMNSKWVRPIEKLLRLVAEGEQDQAENMIQQNSKLLLATGTVTDLSERRFQRITAFQYALWALDWHMWTMLLKYLPEEAAAQQCAELEAKGTVQHGHHFSLQPLITALQKYIDNYGGWSVAECEKHWCKVVGGEQRKLAVHVVNEYCHPSRAFDPCPDFEEAALPRSRKLDEGEWFTAKYSGGLMGDSFAVARGAALWGVWPAGTARADGGGVVGEDAFDLKALQALSQTRTQQLELLKTRLASVSSGLVARK